MSELDTFSFDADGHLDMSQFPDDGTDLSGSDIIDLRDTLLSDPVIEPTSEEWGDLVGEVDFAGVTDVDNVSGPFELDSELLGAGLETADSHDVVADNEGGVIPADGDETDLPLDEDGVDGVDAFELDGTDDFDSSLEFDATGDSFADAELDGDFDTPSSPTAGSDFEDLL